MRFYEFANNTQPALPEPSVVKQQQRVGKVLQQMAASEKQQKTTEMDKVLAMRLRAKQQKQADAGYVERLRRQLALANNMPVK